MYHTPRSFLRGRSLHPPLNFSDPAITDAAQGPTSNTLLCFPSVLSELRTPATATAAIQTAPPMIHRQTAATRPAPPRMTVTAAVTATMTVLPPPLPPPRPHPPTAQTQGAAAILIRDPQRRRKRRNKCWNEWVWSTSFVSPSHVSNPYYFFYDPRSCLVWTWDIFGGLNPCGSILLRKKLRLEEMFGCCILFPQFLLSVQ